MKHIVIIGNGAAANSAVETIRQHDTQIPIIMVAREELPEYSACALPDYLSGWVDRQRLFIKTAEDYSRMGIQMRWGQEVSCIDPEQRLLITDQENIPYEQLILATGSRGLIPPLPGCGLQGNFAIKTVADIDALINHKPSRVLVVGSGNIGVEAAEALQSRGCQVTMVELRERIMPRIFDHEPARRIQDILSVHGIQVLTSEVVLAINGDQRVVAATTDQRSIPCDTVIWAAGVKQNVEQAQAAGIKTGILGGIQVDAYMRTNIDGIYACGDCIEAIDMLTGVPSLSLLWPSAKRQGQVAALNCLGQEVQYEGAVSLVVEDIYGTNAVSMGLTSDALPDGDTKILEGQDSRQYWRVLVQDDRIMGMQSLGINAGLGAVMGLMNNRIPLMEIKRVLADACLIRRAAWYLPARRFLEI